MCLLVSMLKHVYVCCSALVCVTSAASCFPRPCTRWRKLTTAWKLFVRGIACDASAEIHALKMSTFAFFLLLLSASCRCADGAVEIPGRLSMHQFQMQPRGAALPASAQIINKHKMLPSLLGVELNSERGAGKRAQEKGVTIEEKRLRALLQN